jgi:hypothetical protein
VGVVGWWGGERETERESERERARGVGERKIRVGVPTTRWVLGRARIESRE